MLRLLDLINAFDRRYYLGEDGEMEIPVWGPRRGLFVGGGAKSLSESASAPLNPEARVTLQRPH